MPHNESSRPFKFVAGCDQPKYSPLPVSPDPFDRPPTTGKNNMTLKSQLIAMKSRSSDNTMRIDSPPGTAGEDDGPGVEDRTVYKVYKRRWLGVAIIMLLNIVSSWR
jgi:hypothetical protein